MHRSARLVVGIGLALLTSVAVQAKEKKVKQGDLPPAVLRTAEAQSTGSDVQVSGYTKDTVEGVTLYKMGLVVAGKARGVEIAPDGTLVAIEDEVAWEAVPADVQTAFTRASGKGKLGDFRSVTKDGKVVSYNAMLETWGNRDRVSIRPRTLAPEAMPAAPPASDKK